MNYSIFLRALRLLSQQLLLALLGVLLSPLWLLNLVWLMMLKLLRPQSQETQKQRQK